MTVKDFQKQIANALGGVEALVQGGCKVFAEDMLTTQNALNNAVVTAGRIAVVVVTPRLNRDAGGCADGLPSDVSLLVSCIEAPAHRDKRNGFTALDAAEIIAHELDGETVNWRSIEQRSDEARGVITATAEFGVSVILSNPTNERN